ncbi:MAG TPA: alkaline phosphatase family protein [Gemmatimonadaceae bacterium]|nr:alkaline phosphatase family protein [Gemmatimonadaceae bacterium]
MKPLKSSFYPLRFALTAVAMVACTSPPQPPANGANGGTVSQQGATLRHGRVTDHVIVISIDGLRPDAIDEFQATTLQRLRREGRYAPSAQTIGLSVTLPSHVSMLSGLSLEQHGVTWNDDEVRQRGYVTAPTVFSLAHSAGFVTAAVFSKTKFHHLEVPSTLDYSRTPRGGFISLFSVGRAVDYLADYLDTASPNLVFIHIMDPDQAGHSLGWMSRAYGSAVQHVDRGVERILERATARFGAGKFTVIVTADHGGHDRTHGTPDPVDTTIPWIVWGAGVQAGDTLTGVRTMDTAATVLWLLGIDAPANITGRPVTAAFEASAVAGVH